MKPLTRVLIILGATNLILLGVIVWLVTGSQSSAPAVSVSQTSQPSPRPKLEFLPGTASLDVSPGQQAAAPLQSPSNPTAAVAASPARSASRQSVAPRPPRITTPVFLIDPTPDLHLNEDQLQRLELLRQQFADAVGGENQNPSDPEYRLRWVKAQTQLDAQCRSYFGEAIFNRLQMEVARRESNQPGNH